jgi:hypothetical protein
MEGKERKLHTKRNKGKGNRKRVGFLIVGTFSRILLHDFVICDQESKYTVIWVFTVRTCKHVHS